MRALLVLALLATPAVAERSHAKIRAKPAAREGTQLDRDDRSGHDDHGDRDDDLDARAEQALATIDGATVVGVHRGTDPGASTSTTPRASTPGTTGSTRIHASRWTSGPGDRRSSGEALHDGERRGDREVPWDSEPTRDGQALRDGEALPQGEGYRIRRPQRAFGASHVVAHLQHVIAEVRALFPGVHTLAIGDLSQRGGGKIADHLSHRSGLDVDVGFYFHTQPAGYPAAFVAANRDLDLEATWALLTAFARTADLPTGVQMIFLDHAIQARLYKFARARGTPDADLAAILQYPRGDDELVGLVRHWPNHTDHLHVRFKPER